MLQVSAAKAAIVGIKLGKDLSGVTMSCHSGRPEDQEEGLHGWSGDLLVWVGRSLAVPAAARSSPTTAAIPHEPSHNCIAGAKESCQHVQCITT